MEIRERRQLLDAVARGEVTPEEAATRLVDDHAHAASDVRADQEQIGAIRIEARGARVSVVGDEAVETVEVEGDHRLSRERDVTVVCISSRRRDLHGRGRWQAPRAWRDWDPLGSRRDEERIVVRVAPHLGLTIDARAARLDVKGVRGRLSLRLTACSAKVSDVTSPFTAEIRSTRLLLRGRLDAGDSSLDCRSSQVRLELDPSSDVRVHPRSRRVHVRPPRGHRLDRTGSVTLGSGTARVAVDGSSSIVDVCTPDVERTRGR